MSKRVYHPTLNTWADVEDGAAKDWKDAGWRLTKPEHVDDSDAPAPGEGYVPPAVVVDEPAVVAVEPAKADAK